MRKISVVMAYYENPGMLRRQVEHLATFKADLLECLEYVVVDDGSPKFPAAFNQDVLKFACQMWRMGVDIRWNQDACRNLGVREARNEWVLITDMDHMIPETTFRGVTTEVLSERSIYKFTRVDDVTFTEYKPHPNSWLMTKEMYNKVGGYDERFAGYYGTDWDFRDRAMRAAEYIKMLPLPLVRVGREHTPDASCPREFGRKSPADAQAIRRIHGARGNLPPQRFRFPHSLVFRWP